MPHSSSRPFKQVDVFTAQPYHGNALAVVLDANGLSDEQMQRFARWTNLSETTFLLKPQAPEADYRVRIFTPGGELPFAGHPTIGTCHAWLEAGGAPKAGDTVVQECGVGLVRVRRSATRLAFAAPRLQRREPDPAALAAVLAATGLQASEVLEAQLLDNGPVWFGLLVDSPATVLRLAPDHRELARLGQKVGVVAAYPGASARGPDAEVRAFAAPIGVNEDPVTGSLNASLAQWLIDEGRMPQQYVAAQGRCLDRDGQVFLQRDAGGQVWVGGEAVTCIDGTVLL
jgi:PhzF family phenazine biosynthesis protein